MRILGVDASLSQTGICLYDNGQYEHGTIKTKVDKDRFRRYQLILSKIKSFEPIDLVVIEGYAYAASGANNYKLVELGSVLRNHWYSSAIPFIEVGPSALKKLITGNGRAGKLDMTKACEQSYGFAFTNDNECDAFCLIQYFLEAKQCQGLKH